MMISPFYQVCTSCATDIADCPWLHEDKPVEGWVAYPSQVLMQDKLRDTYKIISCPLHTVNPNCGSTEVCLANCEICIQLKGERNAKERNSKIDAVLRKSNIELEGT